MITSCTECGGKVSDKADACPHCGAQVKKPEEWEPCAECQEPLPSGVAKCPACGAPIGRRRDDEDTVTVDPLHEFHEFWDKTERDAATIVDKLDLQPDKRERWIKNIAGDIRDAHEMGYEHQRLIRRGVLLENRSAATLSSFTLVTEGYDHGDTDEARDAWVKILIQTLSDAYEKGKEKGNYCYLTPLPPPPRAPCGCPLHYPQIHSSQWAICITDHYVRWACSEDVPDEWGIAQEISREYLSTFPIIRSPPTQKDIRRESPPSEVDDYRDVTEWLGKWAKGFFVAFIVIGIGIVALIWQVSAPVALILAVVGYIILQLMYEVMKGLKIWFGM